MEDHDQISSNISKSSSSSLSLFFFFFCFGKAFEK